MASFAFCLIESVRAALQGEIESTAGQDFAEAERRL